MKFWLRICVLLFGIGFGAETALHAQLAPRGFSLQFNRQNNFTWQTQAELDYFREVGKYSFQLQGVHSNIYNTSLEQNRMVQLYFAFNLIQKWKFSKQLSALSWVETDQYLNNRNEKYSIYGGMEWRPLDYLRITPLAGIAFDRRMERLDTGFSPGLRISLDKKINEGTRTYLEAFARWKFINPRRQYNFRLYNAWEAKFNESAAIRAGIRGGMHQLDDYTGNSVQGILSDTLEPFVSLRYDFVPGFTWVSDARFSLTRREFSFNWLVPNGFVVDSVNGDTTYSEFNDKLFDGLNFFTRQELRLDKGKWEILTAYEYEYLNRRYDLENTISKEPSDPLFALEEEREQEKDFISNRHKLEVRATRDLNARHQLQLSYTAQYLQFDTPSEQNFNDRDDVSYLGSTRWVSTWNKRFQTKLGLSGNYRHLAFLFGEKSQDNYKQRSLRLDFNYVWHLADWVTFGGEQAVYVTYNVKDFTDFNLTDRSTRNLQNNFRLDLQPTKSLRTLLTVNRKEMHQSYLNWGSFSETTLDTTIFSTLELKNEYQIPLKSKKIRLNAELGYKHFSQIKRQKATMNGIDNVVRPILLKQITRQTGPGTGLTIRTRSGRGRLKVWVWWQTQIRNHQFRDASVVGNLSGILQEADLRQRTAELRPVVQIEALFLIR